MWFVQEQICWVPAVECPEAEGVQEQDDLVPLELQEAQEGRCYPWGDLQGYPAFWRGYATQACRWVKFVRLFDFSFRIYS